MPEAQKNDYASRASVMEPPQKYRAVSGFNLFLKETFAKANATALVSDIQGFMKKAAEAWKNLPISEKEVYNKKAHDLPKRPVKKKRALSAADVFKKEQAKKLKESGKMFNLKMLSEEYAKLSAEEKNKYSEMAVQSEKTKRSPSAWMIFLKDFISRKASPIDLGSVVKEASQKFKNLTESEKQALLAGKRS